MKYRHILEEETGDNGKIEEIFFSEKYNTCYGGASWWNNYGNTKFYWIIDLLSNKYIESIPGNEKIVLDESMYNGKIKELKGKE